MGGTREIRSSSSGPSTKVAQLQPPKKDNSFLQIRNNIKNIEMWMASLQSEYEGIQKNANWKNIQLELSNISNNLN